MKGEITHILQHRLKRRRGDTRKMAAQLAPLEELRPEVNAGSGVPGDSAGLVSQENGAILVGNHRLHLSKDVVEGETQKRFRVERVALVIVLLMLAFIIFIAWQVSQMPAN
jgi:hypothetical protein